MMSMRKMWLMSWGLEGSNRERLMIKDGELAAKRSYERIHEKEQHWHDNDIRHPQPITLATVGIETVSDRNQRAGRCCGRCLRD